MKQREGAGTLQTIEEIQEDFIRNFNEIGDWMMQYEFLLEIGGSLEPYPDEKRDEAHRIQGCQSKMWIDCSVSGGRIHIYGDSEALIVKGIAAVAIIMFQDQRVEDVAAADVVYVENTDLKNQISTDRFHGIQSVIAHIQKFAQERCV